MLAVKLHKKKHLHLGKLSHFVPIFNWRTGERCIRNWVPILEELYLPTSNSKINYISLVRIPDDHPVYLEPYWCWFGYDRPFNKIPKKFKDRFMVWQDKGLTFDAEGNYRDETHDGDMREEVPQLVLQKRLPTRHHLWTKDYRLLTRGELRNDRRRSERRSDKQRRKFEI